MSFSGEDERYDRAFSALSSATSGLSNLSKSKLITPNQHFEGVNDVSEAMILQGKSPYLFLQHGGTKESVIIMYTGKQVQSESDVGDIFKSNTLLQLHLNREDTTLISTKFNIVPRIVSMNTEQDKIEWQKRLATYFLLRQYNIFTFPLDLTVPKQKKLFLYRFIMKKTKKIERRAVRKLFKAKVITMFEGSVESDVLSELGTLAEGPNALSRSETADSNRSGTPPPQPDPRIEQQNQRIAQLESALEETYEKADRSRLAAEKAMLDANTLRKTLEEAKQQDDGLATGYPPDEQAERIEELEKQLKDQREEFETRLNEAKAKAKEEMSRYKEEADALSRKAAEEVQANLEEKLQRATDEKQATNAELARLVVELEEIKNNQYTWQQNALNAKLDELERKIAEKEESLAEDGSSESSGESKSPTLTTPPRPERTDFATKKETAKELLAAQQRQIAARFQSEQSQWEKDQEKMKSLLKTSQDKFNMFLFVVNKEDAQVTFKGQRGTLKKGTLVLGESNNDEYTKVYVLDGRKDVADDEAAKHVWTLQNRQGTGKGFQIKNEDLETPADDQVNALHAKQIKEVKAEGKKLDEEIEKKIQSIQITDKAARQTLVNQFKKEKEGKMKALDDKHDREVRELVLKDKNIAYKLHPNNYSSVETGGFEGTGVDYLKTWEELLKAQELKDERNEQFKELKEFHKKKIIELLEQSRRNDEEGAKLEKDTLVYEQDIKLGTVLFDTDLLLWSDKKTKVGKVKKGTKVLCFEEQQGGMFSNSYCHAVVLDYREGMIEESAGGYFSGKSTTMQELLLLNQEGKLCMQKTATMGGVYTDEDGPGRSTANRWTREEQIQDVKDNFDEKWLSYAIAMYPYAYKTFAEKNEVTPHYKPLDRLRPTNASGVQTRSGFEDWKKFIDVKRKGEVAAIEAQQKAQEERDKATKGKFEEGTLEEVEEKVDAKSDAVADPEVIQFNKKLKTLLFDTRQRLGLKRRDLFLGFLNAKQTEIYSVGDIGKEGATRVGFANEKALVLCLSHGVRSTSSGDKRVARVVPIDQRSDKWSDQLFQISATISGSVTPDTLVDYEMYYWIPGSETSTTNATVEDDPETGTLDNAISNFEDEALEDGTINISDFKDGLKDYGYPVLEKQIDAFVREQGKQTTKEQRQDLEKLTETSFDGVKEQIREFLQQGKDVSLQDGDEVVKTSIRLARITGNKNEEREGVQTWDWNYVGNFRGGAVGKIQVGALVLVLLEKDVGLLTSSLYSKILFLDDRIDYADQAVREFSNEPGKYLAIKTDKHLEFVDEPTDADIVALKASELQEEMWLSDYVLGERLLQKFGGKDWRKDNRPGLLKFGIKGTRYDFWDEELAKVVNQPEAQPEPETQPQPEPEPEPEQEPEPEPEAQPEPEPEPQPQPEAKEGEPPQREAQPEEYTHWIKKKSGKWTQVKDYEPATTGAGGNGGFHSGKPKDGDRIKAKGSNVAKTNAEYKAYLVKKEADRKKAADRREAKKKSGGGGGGGGGGGRPATRSQTTGRRTRSGRRSRYMEEGMIDE